MQITKKKLKEIKEVLGPHARIKRASDEKKPKSKVARKVSSILKFKTAKCRDMKRAEWTSCGKKKRYASQHEARQIANNCERARPGTKLRVYFCPMCEGWHITSKPMKKLP